MRCRSVRAALLDRELGLGAPAVDAALDRHLESCASCAAGASVEAGLSELLAGLRSSSPPAIDVTARVMRGLPELRPSRGEDVSSRQLGWATAAALTAVAGLLAGFWRMLPTLTHAAGDAWTTASGLRHSLGTVLAATATLASHGLETVARLFDALAPMAVALRGLEPVAVSALALSAAVMAATIVLVVGRDLRTRILPNKGNPI